MFLIYTIYNNQSIDDELKNKLNSNYEIINVKIHLDKLIEDFDKYDDIQIFFKNAEMYKKLILFVYTFNHYYDNIIEYKCIPYRSWVSDTFFVSDDIKCYFSNDGTFCQNVIKFEIELVYKPTIYYYSFDHIYHLFESKELKLNNKNNYILSNHYFNINELINDLSIYMNITINEANKILEHLQNTHKLIIFSSIKDISSCDINYNVISDINYI